MQILNNNSKTEEDEVDAAANVASAREESTVQSDERISVTAAKGTHYSLRVRGYF